MVGHLLEYHPAVHRLKELLDEGELGGLYYIYGNRLNLGKLRAEENALWSLGAHDVSVVLHLIGEEPIECSAHGESYVREGVQDVVFCYLRFPSGVVAHLHLSWLDPHKERRLTVVGARRMATFDDMAVEGKLTVYDKGFDEAARTWGEYIARSGESFSPQIANAEPLRIECEHFIDASATAPRHARTATPDSVSCASWSACRTRSKITAAFSDEAGFARDPHSGRGIDARPPRPALPSLSAIRIGAL